MSNRVHLLDDYGILVEFDLSNPDDQDIANGLLAEAEDDGLSRNDLAGLIILDRVERNGGLQCWVGDGWAVFANNAESPKIYRSIASVRRAMKKVLEMFGVPDAYRVRKNESMYVAFWLRDDVDFASFKKYSLLTGVGLFLLARFAKKGQHKGRPAVTCSLCNDEMPLRDFEGHVRNRHFHENA